MNGLTILLVVIGVAIGYMLGWCDGLDADNQAEHDPYLDTYD